MKKELYEMLMASAQSDKSKALLTLDLLSNHPVGSIAKAYSGIGDHSTTDFYNNAEEALKTLVDADDRINTLTKYFDKTVHKKQING